MSRVFLLLLTLFPAAGVLAHPGHGKPGFVHEHGDWLALAALALYALALLGLAGWAALRRTKTPRA